MPNSVHMVHNAPHVYECELTDTFGGEPNYCWVRRETVTFEKNYSDRKAVRRIKAALGLTGVRCRVHWDGYGYTIRPRGLLQVAFAQITF